MDDFQIDKDESPKFIQSSQFKNFMASSIPSFILRPILHPLEVIKVRSQLNRNHSTLSIRQTAKVVCNEQCWPVLYRGLYYSQFVSVTSSILQFSMYRNFRKILHRSWMGESEKSCDFLAGFLMGATSAILINPLDIVRTLLLAREKDNKNGVIEITKSIYKNGKIARFYSGAFTGVWHIGMLNGLRFMFYNTCCRIAINYESVKSRKELRPVQLIVSGIIAGILANFMAYPLEFIKRRMQLDKSRMSVSIPKKISHGSELCLAIIQCALGVARTEGFLAFYNGFIPNATKSIISTGVQFAFYDIIYNWIGDIVD